jgi:hypothetical protein
MALSHAKRIIPVFPCVIRFYEKAMPLEASESACTVCNLHIYISPSSTSRPSLQSFYFCYSVNFKPLRRLPLPPNLRPVSRVNTTFLVTSHKLG